ncbi:hypothetical protein AUC45_03960 [Erythrobacter sp. YT30]|nr:hypothetical protein AUC45_03960 [Erythrobacter sp. YT30]
MSFSQSRWPLSAKGQRAGSEKVSAESKWQAIFAIGSGAFASIDYKQSILLISVTFLSCDEARSDQALSL